MLTLFHQPTLQDPVPSNVLLKKQPTEGYRFSQFPNQSEKQLGDRLVKVAYFIRTTHTNEVLVTTGSMSFLHTAPVVITPEDFGLLNRVDSGGAYIFDIMMKTVARDVQSRLSIYVPKALEAMIQSSFIPWGFYATYSEEDDGEVLYLLAEIVVLDESAEECFPKLNLRLPCVMLPIQTLFEIYDKGLFGIFPPVSDNPTLSFTLSKECLRFTQESKTHPLEDYSEE